MHPFLNPSILKTWRYTWLRIWKFYIHKRICLWEFYRHWHSNAVYFLNQPILMVGVNYDSLHSSQAFWWIPFWFSSMPSPYFLFWIWCWIDHTYFTRSVSYFAGSIPLWISFKTLVCCNFVFYCSTRWKYLGGQVGYLILDVKKTISLVCLFSWFSHVDEGILIAVDDTYLSCK